MRYCQTPPPGEEEIIEQILSAAGLLKGGWAVEFGSNDGQWLSNTKFLEERHGFRRILFDRGKFPGVIQAEVRPDNIEELFSRYVPSEPAVISIDIDGNDYWVRKALKTRAAVIVQEYNGSIPPLESKSIPYQPDFVWAEDGYYGASWTALKTLNASMGYRYVCQCGSLNMFFIREDLARPNMPWNDKVPNRVIPGPTPRNNWIEV